MSDVGDTRQLCELCRCIFHGHWQAREEDDDSGNESLDEWNEEKCFYERPDWLQSEGGANSSIDTPSSLKQSSPAHHSILALETSAKNGCHLCMIIWDQLQSRLQNLREKLGDDLRRAIGMVVARPSFDSVDNEDPRNSPEPVDLEILYFLDGKCEARDAYVTTVGIDL